MIDLTKAPDFTRAPATLIELNNARALLNEKLSFWQRFVTISDWFIALSFLFVLLAPLLGPLEDHNIILFFPLAIFVVSVALNIKARTRVGFIQMQIKLLDPISRKEYVDIDMALNKFDEIRGLSVASKIEDNISSAQCDEGLVLVQHTDLEQVKIYLHAVGALGRDRDLTNQEADAIKMVIDRSIENEMKNKESISNDVVRKKVLGLE